jgi:ankyrin repeat protein
MDFMKASDLLKLINTGNYHQLRQTLEAAPDLANAGVPCSDDKPEMKGHPLHRICDAVFANVITDEQAIEIAKILLEFGANIDGYKSSGDNNTPLIAASSLHAEKLGIFYIEQGADIFYAPNDGATALHWAAFCGRDQLVAALIAKGANIDQPDATFDSTPIGWAVHTLTSGDTRNLYNQLTCVKQLLKAGADKEMLHFDTINYLRNAANNDAELKMLIS